MGSAPGVPFALALLFAPLLPLDTVIGQANHRGSLLLVIGIAVAVTSIPVISRIFHDLKILHTRFARLVLGVAVIEDIVLWGVLAVATGLATSGSASPRRARGSRRCRPALFRARLDALSTPVRWMARPRGMCWRGMHRSPSSSRCCSPTRRPEPPWTSARCSRHSSPATPWSPSEGCDGPRPRSTGCPSPSSCPSTLPSSGINST